MGTSGMQQVFGSMCLTLRQHHPAVDSAAPKKEKIECFLSAVYPGWLASNRSNLIGIAGPASVLDSTGLRHVLPSRLGLEEFGFALPDA